MVRERRHGGQGFTLIELLVVIIILGIISGVVVFAVRGTGDKGEANAKAADKRIVRTAMETFCARYGRYAEDMDELVEGPRDGAGGRLGKGFLSEASTYNHDIVVSQGGPNSCGGSGYEIVESTECVQLDDGGEEVTVDAKSDMWCLAAPPKPPDGEIDGDDRSSPVVQLLNGKVLVMREEKEMSPSAFGGGISKAGRTVQLFDPTAGTRGAWSDAAPARYSDRPWHSADINELLVLGARPGSEAAQCGEHCGKAMLNFVNEGWQLYDPDGDDGVDGTEGAWAPVEPSPPSGRAVQLIGDGCGGHCGKVLILTGGYPAFSLLVWDPTTNVTEPLVAYEGKSDYLVFHLAELDHGRVLVTAATCCFGVQPNRAAFLVDVDARTLTQIDDPHWRYLTRTGSAALPGGSVLFQWWGHSAGDIYHPDSVGKGRWEEVPCTTRYCDLKGRLSDGRVVYRQTAADMRTTTLRLFDSTKPDSGGRWSDMAAFNDKASMGGEGVRIAHGPCGVHCDNLLVVSDKSAEIYFP